MQNSAMGLVTELGTALAAAAAPPAAAGGGRGRASSSSATVSSRFNSQLEDLMVGLEGTGLHFVRCIKPNSKLQPNTFEQQMILSQLR
jgi:myosin heavy subunit